MPICCISRSRPTSRSPVRSGRHDGVGEGCRIRRRYHAGVRRERRWWLCDSDRSCADRAGATRSPDVPARRSSSPSATSALGRTSDASSRPRVLMLRRLLIGGFAVSSLLLASPAHAQGAGGWATFPDQVVSQYTSLAAGWTSSFQSYALGLFALLATISLAWTAIKLALRGAVVEEFIAELLNFIFFIGIGAFALANGPSLLAGIVDSLRQAGKGASGVGLAPSQILAVGLTIAGQTWQHISAWDPGASAGLIIVAIVVLLCIAWIAGWMVVALVQVAFYVPIATLFLGFAGSPWTRDIAIGMLRQSLALGAKLMVLELLASAGLQMIKSMVGVLNDFTGFNAGVIIAASFVLAMLTKVLPDWVAGVLGGSSIGEGGRVAAAAAGAAAAAVGAGLVAGGVAPMVANAARLGAAQTAAADAKGGEDAPERSRLGRIAATTGNAARNLAVAPMMDVSRRLSGQYSARHGSSTWRMSAELANRTRLLEDDNAKPRPPSTNNPGNPNTISN